eukprot:366469-Chlamydomonas_euryale.AAC.5
MARSNYRIGRCRCRRRTWCCSGVRVAMAVDWGGGWGRADFLADWACMSRGRRAAGCPSSVCRQMRMLPPSPTPHRLLFGGDLIAFDEKTTYPASDGDRWQTVPVADAAHFRNCTATARKRTPTLPLTHMASQTAFMLWQRAVATHVQTFIATAAISATHEASATATAATTEGSICRSPSEPLRQRISCSTGMITCATIKSFPVPGSFGGKLQAIQGQV